MRVAQLRMCGPSYLQTNVASFQCLKLVKRLVGRKLRVSLSQSINTVLAIQRFNQPPLLLLRPSLLRSTQHSIQLSTRRSIQLSTQRSTRPSTQHSILRAPFPRSIQLTDPQKYRPRLLLKSPGQHHPRSLQRPTQQHFQHPTRQNHAPQSFRPQKASSLPRVPSQVLLLPNQPKPRRQVKMARAREKEKATLTRRRSLTRAKARAKARGWRRLIKARACRRLPRLHRQKARARAKAKARAPKMILKATKGTHFLNTTRRRAKKKTGMVVTPRSLQSRQAAGEYSTLSSAKSLSHPCFQYLGGAEEQLRRLVVWLTSRQRHSNQRGCPPQYQLMHLV
mmetsp:Transcript_23878/g.56254  ORF Transcript_23878/g.56254 Transcript_23878/m.56254 type:complete len:337 (-) Transcript_23878:653-1663(-)